MKLSAGQENTVVKIHAAGIAGLKAFNIHMSTVKSLLRHRLICTDDAVPCKLSRLRLTDLGREHLPATGDVPKTAPTAPTATIKRVKKQSIAKPSTPPKESVAVAHKTDIAAIKKRFEKPIPVLDKGYVQLVDLMGGDEDIVAGARNSYTGHGTDGEIRTMSENEKLTRYLFRHRHGSPIELVSAKFQIRLPMDVMRQWIRHRTAKTNEYSTRYSPVIDAVVETDPRAWRQQSASSKQGSAGFVEEFPDGWELPGYIDYDGSLFKDLSPGEYLSRREAAVHHIAREVYNERLAFGVAKEQARKDIPLCNYTEIVWKMDARNLFHFLGLRLHEHAQEEIRQFAKAIFEIVKVWLPIASRAFIDYQLEAITFSRIEVEILRSIVTQQVWDHSVEEIRKMAKQTFDRDQEETGVEISKRERGEFLRKIKLIG